MKFDKETIFRLEDCLKKYDEINQKLSYEEVLLDEKLTIRLEKEKKALEPIIEKYQTLKKLETANRVFLKEKEMLYDKNCEIEKQIEKLKNDILFLLSNQSSKIQKVRIEILSKNPSTKLFEYIVKNYNLFCKKQNLQIIEVNSFSNVNDKNLTIDIEGQNSYDFFVNENGIHKNNKNVVTVIAYPIYEKENVTFNDNDVKIDIYRSNGAGGQNVNKVSTAVRITHLKTGIVATCQDERSQIQNKKRALETLKERVLLKIQNDYQKQILKFKKEHIKTSVVRYYDFDKNIIMDIKLNAEFNIDDNTILNILNLNKLRG